MQSEEIKSEPQVRATIPVIYAHEKSADWDRATFRKIIETKSQNPLLKRIAERRVALGRLSTRSLHGSYKGSEVKQSAAGDMRVHPKTISLPPAYGNILYMLTTHTKAQFAVEGGSGFGISTMYMTAAMMNQREGSLLSFEIASYAGIAQASADIIGNRTTVVNDDFLNFTHHINASTEIDFAFIDARHDEEAIRSSVKTLAGWLSPKGMIVIDDIGYSDSSRAGFRAVVRSGHFSFAALINGRLGVLAR